MKRSHTFNDEASNYTGASSQSKREGKRVLALVAVRHQKKSPSISAQEKDAIRSHRLGESRSGIGRPVANGSTVQKKRKLQDRHRVTDCTAQVPRGIQKSQWQEGQIWNVTVGCQEENSRMHRRCLVASSPEIPMRKHRETECRLR